MSIGKALIVDDSKVVQFKLKRMLEARGLGVDTASSGHEALDYLNRRGEFADPANSPKPDLILLDLNLPWVDGRQVLAEMRDDPDLRRIPVVALTTSREDEDILRTYDLGVNSYIPKPVDMGQFVDILRSLENYWFEVVMLPPSEG